MQYCPTKTVQAVPEQLAHILKLRLTAAKSVVPISIEVRPLLDKEIICRPVVQYMSFGLGQLHIPRNCLEMLGIRKMHETLGRHDITGALGCSAADTESSAH